MAEFKTMGELTTYLDRLTIEKKRIQIGGIMRKLAENVADENVPRAHKHGQNGGCADAVWQSKVESSILKYIDTRLKCATKKTTAKYVVILYGPPGSGKTLARKVAINYISKVFGEDASDSFIDAGLDDIIYENIDENGETVKSKLIKNIRTKLEILRTAHENVEKVDNDVLELHTKTNTQGESAYKHINYNDMTTTNTLCGK